LTHGATARIVLSVSTRIRLVAAAAIVVAASALTAFAAEARLEANFVEGLHLPGTVAPDVSSLERLVLVAAATSVVGLLLVVILVLRQGRALFAVSAVWSAFAALMTLATLATTSNLSLGVIIGGFVVTPTMTVGVVAVAAIIALSASLIGWTRSPAETIARPIYMPPPTHLD
jgi:hypothetical protein